VLASLHHSVRLGDAQVHTGCIDGALALRARLVFAGQLEVLLEETDRLLDKALLVMKETELECCISLSLSLVLSFSDVHQLSQMMNRHLNVAALCVHISQQLMCLALFIA